MAVEVRIAPGDVAAIQTAAREIRGATTKLSAAELRSALSKVNGAIAGILNHLEEINRFLGTAATKEDLSRQRQALETARGGIGAALRVAPAATRLGPYGIPVVVVAGLAGAAAGSEVEERRRQIEAVQKAMSDERFLMLRTTERFLREVRAREEAYERALRTRR